ncbi:helix-turn-helix transcriptional regulator [Streptomyces sp. NPDC015220]|uniref:helix-turn-helix domain-containing protein n=1 Tax=Streptomyces sp. NPDC015220 TaxID=3364947 RepID=UPI0037007F12
MTRVTARQRQVLLLAAGGNTNAAIAARLGITSGTVNELLGTAYRRLGARDRTHAVALAIWCGDISLADLATIAQPTSQERAA